MVSEQDLTHERELIWKNLITIFNEKKNIPDELLIRRQKKMINLTNIYGKNKFKSITVLNNYLTSKDKLLGEQVFWNTVNRKLKNST